jgi:hypothetical protein
MSRLRKIKMNANGQGGKKENEMVKFQGGENGE